MHRTCAAGGTVCQRHNCFRLYNVVYVILYILFIFSRTSMNGAIKPNYGDVPLRSYSLNLIVICICVIRSHVYVQTLTRLACLPLSPQLLSVRACTTLILIMYCEIVWNPTQNLENSHADSKTVVDPPQSARQSWAGRRSAAEDRYSSDFCTTSHILPADTFDTTLVLSLSMVQVDVDSQVTVGNCSLQWCFCFCLCTIQLGKSPRATTKR